MTEDERQIPTLTDRVRHYTGGLTKWLGEWGVRLHIHPDLVTLVGLVIVLVGAVIAARGQFLLAGLILLVGMPLDAVDGAIARAMGRTDRFGALLDSTFDRYADGAMLFALAYYFADRGELVQMTVAGVALIGGFGVSYVRARAEGLGIRTIKEGWFDRLVRVVVLIAALLTGFVYPGVVILAVGSQFTAAQRIYAVWQATRGDAAPAPPGG